ncbi:MAG: tetratricopeptide repeat protein [Lachnospiraceae bacterium]|nr:tetratricopeptide repeat protein [Lachnospiraceae bacterium]
MRKIRRALLFGVVLILCAGCSSGKGEDLNREGLRLFREGQFSEAVAVFEEAIVEDNREPLYYDNMGMAYLEMKDYASAESAFQMALNLSEKDKYAYRGLGISYLRQGRYEEAVAAFFTAIEMAGTKVGQAEYDTLLYRAEAELGMGDYAGAVATYGILVEAEPKNADYRYLRGRAFLMQGSLESALAEFNTGVTHAPKDYAYYMNIYKLLDERGYAEEGTNYLKSALTIGGDSDEIHRYRGEIQYLLENYSSAAAEFQAVKAPLDSRCLIFLGNSYSRMGEAQKAYQVYTEALDRAPEKAPLYGELALLKMEEGDYRTALDFLGQGIALNDASVQKDLKYAEAVCYEYLHEYRTALEKFEAWQAEFGESPEATHEIEFLRTR